MAEKILSQGCKVIHKTLGAGTVVTDMGDTVVVRFDEKVEICEKDSLETIPDVYEILASGSGFDSYKGLIHAQALIIRSINDKWGVFGRSLIDLLPHQLWVCRQARSKSPCRLLVADDVGLGKTIEAGIILSSFLGSGKVKRILILTPSSLVSQWQYRMKSMFDVRLSLYTPDQDTPKSAYWECHDEVVASFHTLRMDNNNRMERLLSAEPWDLVIVDEAHHFNKGDKAGATLTYNLLYKMEEQQRIKSMIFFTGTPHKGKDFSFLALMQLLSPNFSPAEPLKEQLHLLKDYMIRNNKYNVTDLHGNKLFKEPLVIPSTYHFSEAEQNFYDTLTKFIVQGFAYAKDQSHTTGNVMMLILIGMQKLASSSVAAIRNALKNRLEKLNQVHRDMRAIKSVIEELQNVREDMENADRLSELEEELLTKGDYISLLQNEIPALRQLIQLADEVEYETKIQTILSLIEEEYPDKQILFFTEYKATQRLLMEKLMANYGKDSATFINGDEYLDAVRLPDGTTRRIALKRELAAERFNEGAHRFLIATEAAGEGIDLQKNCHVLFHVDLPWNPMRLQQRVGRLNRYGQTKQVIVRNFRNPDTVESRIWEKLNTKLASIDQTFGAVMEEKEDMFQLVLGMASPTLFDDLFGEAITHAKDPESLSKWFDVKTAQFGGKDVYKTVAEIIGNSAKFNYQQVSSLLPKVDLKDLLPFIQNSLSYHHKRLVMNDDGELSFLTPEAWKTEFGVKDKYNGFVLNRAPKGKQQVLGIGTKVLDKALCDALSMNAPIISADLESPYLLIAVRDLLTDHSGEKQNVIYGCKLYDLPEPVSCEVVADWKMLQLLNGVQTYERPVERHYDASFLQKLKDIMPQIEEKIKEHFASEVFTPKKPVFSLEAVILPKDW